VYKTTDCRLLSLLKVC